MESSNLLKSSNYLTINEVANVLGVHRNTADKLVKGCKDVKEVLQTNNKGMRKLYNLDEIREIQASQQQQQQLVKLDKTASNLSNSKDIRVVGTAFMKQIDNLDKIDDDSEEKKQIEEDIDKSLYALLFKRIQQKDNKINKLEQAHKEKDKIIKEKEQQKEELEQKQKIVTEMNTALLSRNIILAEKNKDLTEYKEKEQYIFQEKHKNDTTQAKLNKEIKRIAWRNGWKVNETYIRYYKMYDEAHNFPYKDKDGYRGYLQVIRKRGHLLELYEIVVKSGD